MKEKLQEYALLAEIISALAVVITLVILISEVRENTEITRAAAYQSEISKFTDWRREVTSDDSKLFLFYNFDSGEVPEPGSQEALKLNMLLNSLWGAFESGYTSYSSGIIGGAEWDRILRTICSEYPKLIVTNVKDQIFFRLTSDFTNFVESTCIQ